MPPILALLACTVLVLFLLRIESRASCNVSTGMWIPTLWILMVASRSLGAWFGVVGHNDSGNWMDQFALSSLTVGALVIITRRRIDWPGTLRTNAWLLVLIAYMLLSTFWSEITLIAMKRWLREVIVILMALVTMSEAKPLEALATLLRRTSYVLLPFSLVLIKYYPLLGRQYGRWSGLEMWTGVTSQKNQLGRLCMISILFLLFAFYRRWKKIGDPGTRSLRWADASIIVLGFYLLFGANSSTSLATLILGIMIFVTLQLFRRMKLTVPLIGLFAVVLFLIGFGASAPFLGGSNVAMFSSSLDRDDTLTGRTEVWAAVLPALKEQPVLGYGFGSFWTDARRESYEIPTAHNGYLDILLDMGVVGLGLVTIWMLDATRHLRRASALDYGWASIAICFLLMGLIYNATESALNTLTDHTTAIVVLASFVVPYRPPKRRTSPKREMTDELVTRLESSDAGNLWDGTREEATKFLIHKTQAYRVV